MRMDIKAMDGLSLHLKSRLAEIGKAREKGTKIVGYTPGGYMPEELVLACGAIPICLIRGGDHSAVNLAGAYICRWIDPFCRAQIGYAMSGDDPYYNITDLLVVPVTDNHIRSIMDVLDYHTDIEIFPFGVPHLKDESSNDYYLHGITRLRDRIEELTEVKVTESKLREAIDLCNRERELLRKISLLRKSNAVPISARDFVTLNHGSFFADKKVMVGVLESVYEELQGQDDVPVKGPRILFTGSTLALGDSIVLDMIEESGGVIVFEEFAEGLRHYWTDVVPDKDLMKALADSYFMKRTPPAWFRPGKERLDFLVNLAREFNVDGVIWYHLMYREAYKLESYYFQDILKRETGLPMLTLESEYDPSERGQFRTRIETFMETLRRRT